MAKRKKKRAAMGSKKAILVRLLTRKSGCTTEQALAATHWPVVSMPAVARAAGLKLRKEAIEGSRACRYYGR